MNEKQLHPARYQTPWIGREAELKQLAHMLVKPGLFVFLGAPGTGKTRLAIELFQREITGPWVFVDVEKARSATDVIIAIEAALRMTPTQELEPQDALARLASAFRGRGIKRVILDNFEGAVPDAGWVPGELASLNSALRVLVTSRRALGDPRETRVDVAPLSPADGVLLFQERSRRLGAGDHNVASVEELVRRLDALPLAIELAAGRTRILSVEEVLAGLKANDLLEAVGSAPADSRYRSLSSALNTSWQALEPQEQTALRKVCCFRGGFELEAARAVLGERAAELLQKLDDRSLLTIADTNLGRRFRLLVPIREFVSAVAPPDEVLAAAHRAHAEHYEELGRTQAHLTEHGSAKEAARVLEAELHNMQAALERECDERPSLAASLALSIESFLWFRPTSAARILVLTTAVDQAELGGDALLRVRSLGRRAHALVVGGQRERGAADLEKAMSLESTWEMRRVALKAKSMVAFWLSSPSEQAALGRDLLKEGLQHNDPMTQAEGYCVQRAAAIGSGDAESALKCQLRAMELFRSIGMLHRYYTEHGNLAARLVAVKEAGAEDKARKSLAYSQEIGDDRATAFSSMILGVLLLGSEGDAPLEAEEHLERADRIREEGIGHPRIRSSTRYFKALAQLTAGSFSESEQGFLDSRMPHFVCAPMAGAAAARALAGDLTGARRALAESDAHHQDPENSRGNTEWEALKQGLVLGVKLAEARDALEAGDVETAALLLAEIEAAPEPARAVRRIVAHVRTDASFLAAQHDLDVDHPGERKQLVIGSGATWARLPDGKLIDFRNRGPLRRVLLALSVARAADPDSELTTAALFDAGWPGERADRLAAGNRVRVALSNLRKQGFKTILERGEDGYRLSREHPIRIQGLPATASAPKSDP